MSNIILHSEPAALPAPRVAISTRVATMADLPFMDQLQKQHSKELGYFPTKQFEGYIAMGGVLIAEERRSTDSTDDTDLNKEPSVQSVKSVEGVRLGYVISRDRYLKRDELGVVYQLCVRKDLQRGYIGAALLQAVFERAAYGCRLFCCWCAQDLAANRFWESMGFSAVAFRGGSDKKRRVHIFWQKRIRRGDVTTPWWFPSKTEGGALRADRLVLPIPAGVRWDDEMPVVVGEDRVSGVGSRVSGEEKCPRRSRTPKPESRTPRVPVQFGRPGAIAPTPVAPPTTEIVKTPKEKVAKAKCDPKLIAAARELRDRWLEAVNADPMMLASSGKYDVARLPPAQPSPAVAGEGVRAMLSAA